jgi:hypothetical protein
VSFRSLVRFVFAVRSGLQKHQDYIVKLKQLIAYLSILQHRSFIMSSKIILTMKSEASYYSWNKQLQELATESGVHFHLGFDSRNRPRMPKLFADTKKRIRENLELNERERKEFDDHMRRSQAYQKDTALGLKLIKSTVDADVLDHIKANISNYTKPSTTKLLEILKLLHDDLGGVHSDIQDERSTKDLAAIPDFTSQATFSKAMMKLEELKRERESWGANFAWSNSFLILWFKKRLVLENMTTFLYSLTSALTFAEIKSKTVEYFKAVSSRDVMQASRLKETANSIIDNYAGVVTIGRTFGDDAVCYGCGGKGHTKRDCPNPVLSPLEGKARKCYKCGGTDHLISACPLMRKQQHDQRYVQTDKVSRSPSIAAGENVNKRDFGKKRPNPYVKVQGTDGNTKIFRKDLVPKVRAAFQEYNEANVADYDDDYAEMETITAPEGMEIEFIDGAEDA